MSVGDVTETVEGCVCRQCYR